MHSPRDCSLLGNWRLALVRLTCMLVAYAHSGQGAAIMTNSDRGMPLITEILFAVAHEYEWPDYKPTEHTQIKVNPVIFRGYLGRYQLAPNFILTVTQEPITSLLKRQVNRK